MITRNQLFKDFKSQWQNPPIRFMIAAFRSISDESLAEMFNLKVFRKGVFR